MATNELNVKIGAEADGLKRGLSDAAKQINRFEKEADDLKVSLVKVNQQSKALKVEVNKLTKSFKAGEITNEQYEKGIAGIVQKEKMLQSQTSKLQKNLALTQAKAQSLSGGVSKLGKSTANAVPAMTSFSQVIQDAPFGIVGVSNNITQLTAQFGNLKKATGSSSAALKAMLATLSGPGGILLAVSTVTSLLVVYGDELFSTSKDADKLTKEQDKLAESLENYEKTLSDVNKARLKGERNAAKELTNLSLLKNQIEDTALSTEKRAEAVMELRKLYPSYLQGISTESILNEGLTTIYDNLSESILKKAKAQAAASLITKNEEKRLALQLQLEQLSEKIAATKTKQEQDRAKAAKGSAGTYAGIADSFARTAKDSKVINDLEEDRKEISQQISDINAKNLKLSQQVKREGGTVPLDLTITTLEVVTPEQREAITKSLTAIRNEAAVISEGLPSMGLKPLGLNSAITEETQDAKQSLLDFQNSASKIITTGINNTFSSIATEIGAAFANGTSEAEAGGVALLGALGGVLQQYGKLVLATGLASEAFKSAITNPFGGGIGAIAAGAALIAIGGAVKGFAAQQAQKGRQSNAGNVAAIPAPSIPQSTVVNNFDETGGNRRISGELVVKGQDLVIALDRAQKTQLRLT